MEQKNKQFCAFLGWIALDIDGTITLDKYSVPAPVIEFLRTRVDEGWRLAVATGRPLSFALRALGQFDFPYFILAQNGTLAIEMPSQKILLRHYIPISHIPIIDAAFEGVVGDFMVFSGFEHQDQIFWRPHRMDVEQKAYVQDLAKKQCLQTIAVQSFNQIPLTNVPLVKCFGTQIEMNRIANNLQKSGLFNLTMIHDPYVENVYFLLITDRSASKGQTLEEMITLFGPRGTVIAAGDDENDASLLKVADIKIAMAHAPESLIQAAHFVAPPTSEQGIIHALRLALRL